MQITITTLSDQIITIDVGEELELENFKALCQEETAVPASEMVIVWNGRPLHDDKLTLKEYGIKHGDMVLIQHLRGPERRSPQNQARVPAGPGIPNIDFGSIQIPGTSGSSQPQAGPPREDPAFFRDMLLSNPAQLALLKERNPPLADALVSGDIAKFKAVFEEQQAARRKVEEDKRRLLMADPFDPSAQQQIEEAIRMKNVESNMETAMEYSPESFGQVHMLYVDCKVNGFPVKAFVDSGAQMTIMSQACADRCHIMRLVDRRWEGVAKGVGTQKIIGRVHLCQIQIGSTYLGSSFSILENQPMDMLLGLDMLKRHQCVIDLGKNELKIGTTGTVTSFLGEADLPEHARLNQQPGSEDHDLAEAINKSAAVAGGESSSKATQDSSEFPESAVSQLMGHGFSRQQCLEELKTAAGNVDQALASLFSKSFNFQ